MERKGFTLIELLVVITISAVFSSLAIVYSHVGQNQVALSVEASKIAQLILEAKQLSIATYSKGTTSCAYGVHFNFAAKTYSLFSYNSAVGNGPSGPVCPSVASTSVTGVIAADEGRYEGGSAWNVHPAEGVTIMPSSASLSDAITDVIFYPPDPTTLISRDGATWPYPAPTSKVYLQTADGSAAAQISVNSAGQVNL